MAAEWFYQLMNETFGPMTASDLVQKAHEGVIRSDTLVRKGVSGRWIFARMVSGLLPRAVASVSVAESVAAPRPTSDAPAHRPLAPSSADLAPQSSVPLPTAEPIPDELPDDVAAASPPHRSRRWRLLLSAMLLVVGVASIPAYKWFRNRELVTTLEACQSYGVINATAYYADAFDDGAVVLDLAKSHDSGARRIDCVHLLMQFAGKLDLRMVKKVVLAREGKQVYYVAATDLRELTSSYKAGGEPWAFHNLPERCRTMAGSPAYDTWSGGWLGVLAKQANDLNSFIDAWLGS